MTGVRSAERGYAGVGTRVLSVGARRGGPRVLLLHGYRDSADTWHGVLERLGDAGRPAVAVDLPGFGSADPLRTGPVLPQLDRFVADVIKNLGRHGPVTVVGNSLGGTLAVRAAADPALPVGAVVSVAAPGLADSWLIRAVVHNPLLWVYGALPLPVPRAAVVAVGRLLAPLLLYGRARSADPVVVNAFVGRLASALAGTHPPRAMLNQARALLVELRDAYRFDAVRRPLLVLTGGRDRLVTAAAGVLMHDAVAGSALTVLPHCGHCPQLDDPQLVAELIVEFAEQPQAERVG